MSVAMVTTTDAALATISETKGSVRQSNDVEVTAVLKSLLYTKCNRESPHSTNCEDKVIRVSSCLCLSLV